MLRGFESHALRRSRPARKRTPRKLARPEGDADLGAAVSRAEAMPALSDSTRYTAAWVRAIVPVPNPSARMNIAGAIGRLSVRYATMFVRRDLVSSDEPERRRLPRSNFPRCDGFRVRLRIE